MLAAIFVLAIVSYCIYWYLWPRYQNLPPEPIWSVPLIGHFLSLSASTPQVDMMRWYKEKNLPVYNLQFGTVPMIFVNRVDYVKEVLQKRGEVFAERPQTWRFDIIDGKWNRAIFIPENKPWLKRKKIKILLDLK